MVALMKILNYMVGALLTVKECAMLRSSLVMVLSLGLFSSPGDSRDTFDLDVGIPPGSPLEWNTTVRQPVPTGGRAGVPTGASDPEKPGFSGGTVSEPLNPRPGPSYGVTNLYNFFRVTTKDIMIHVSLQTPKGSGEVNPEDTDVATGPGGARPFKIVWNWPPEMPVELIWMAVMAGIRSEIHPEVISRPESIVYCVELGIPAHYGAKSYPGAIGLQVQKWTTPVPRAAPKPKRKKDPFQAMLARLATLELSSGYAYALDPNFARRTLALGEESFEAVLDCVQNRNTLLSQNAVAVLSNFQNEKAAEELQKIFEKSPDPVSRFRAISGLLRRRDDRILPGLLSLANLTGKKNLPHRCYALHALGILGNPKAGPVLREILLRAGTREKDLLWSALPAIARAGDPSPKTLAVVRAVERALWAKCKGTDQVETDSRRNERIERPGTKFRVLRQMALLAAAALGDDRAKKEVFSRMDRKGAGSFHKATWYLLADVLVGLGKEGVEYAKELVKSSPDASMKVHTLRALARKGKADVKFLRKQAGSKVQTVAAMALHLLTKSDRKACAEECRKILAEYAKGSIRVTGDVAFLVATAVEVGGNVEAWKGNAAAATDLVKATRRAWKTGAFARRKGKNEPNITKCRISVHPALLETLLIECGRGGGEKATTLLLELLRDRKSPKGRAEAALALGAIGGEKAVAELLVALEDPDGWLRYCAYVSLKTLSGQDHFVDWIFGTKRARRDFVEKYKEWAAR